MNAPGCQMNSKNECLDWLRTYYGYAPYQDHCSKGSYLLYYWIEQRFDKDLIYECKQHLFREERLPGLKSDD